MTEIPISIYPSEEPMPPVPEPGDWHGLFTGLHIGLGRIARNLPDPRRVRLEKARGVWPVRIDPIPVNLAAGNGFLDLPQVLGPGLGENWDVHTISATGFTAGTVSGWINVPSLANIAVPQGAARFSATSAGFANYGKNQLFLRGRSDRLCFIATGITGVVVISLDATCMTDEFVGEYLL